MDKKTINGLLNLNRDFYDRVWESFDSTRQNYWPGWGRIDYFTNPKPAKKQKILDLGCGNGRFYGFLYKRYPQLNLEYTGIDINRYLLDKAKIKHKQARFILGDVFAKSIFHENKYNLTVGFGLTHHIPGKLFRFEWIKSLGKLLVKDGLLVLSFWMFDTKHSMTPDNNFLKKRYGINMSEMENQDFFLGWSKLPGIFRYCHLFHTAEISEINGEMENSGLRQIMDFSADGVENDHNRYVVWKKS